jgi:hypothetical protein
VTPLFYEDSLGAKLADAFNSLPSADDGLIEDPEELDAAQAAVNGHDSHASYARVRPGWVAVFGPAKLDGMLSSAGISASVLTMPLDAEEIAYVWEPYAPQDAPSTTDNYGRAFPRPFTLLVGPADAQRAKQLLATELGAEATGTGNAMPARQSVSPASGPTRPPDPAITTEGALAAWIRFGVLVLAAVVFGLLMSFLLRNVPLR